MATDLLQALNEPSNVFAGIRGKVGQLKDYAARLHGEGALSNANSGIALEHNLQILTKQIKGYSIFGVPTIIN